jgi:hypothetical protein
MTVLENVHSLVGQSASPEYLQKLTYLCWNHHKAVRHIDTVRAYTFGSHYFVEVDIVLPSAMPLREAHDIGEALQEKLERLPEIDPSDRLDAAVRMLARERGLDDDQRAEMITAAFGVLNDDRFAPVFGAGSRAEVALTGSAPA